jgi:hypothetical protein
LAISKSKSRSRLASHAKTLKVTTPGRPEFLNESDENSSKGLNTPKHSLPSKHPSKNNLNKNKTPGSTQAKKTPISENWPKDKQNPKFRDTSINELPEDPTPNLNPDNDDSGFYNPAWNKSLNKPDHRRQRSTLLDIWEKKNQSSFGLSYYFNKTNMTKYLTEYMIEKKQKEKESLIEIEKSKEKQRSFGSNKYISKIKSIATFKQRVGGDSGARGTKQPTVTRDSNNNTVSGYLGYESQHTKVSGFKQDSITVKGSKVQSIKSETSGPKDSKFQPGFFGNSETFQTYEGRETPDLAQESEKNGSRGDWAVKLTGVQDEGSVFRNVPSNKNVSENITSSKNIFMARLAKKKSADSNSENLVTANTENYIGRGENADVERRNSKRKGLMYVLGQYIQDTAVNTYTEFEKYEKVREKTKTD